MLKNFSHKKKSTKRIKNTKRCWLYALNQYICDDNDDEDKDEDEASGYAFTLEFGDQISVFHIFFRVECRQEIPS